MATPDYLARGSDEYRRFQAERYDRPRRHVAVCRHCDAVVDETRQDATTGVCTNCLRKGRR